MDYRIFIDQSSKDALVEGAPVPLGNYRPVWWKEIMYRNDHSNINGAVEKMIRKLMRVALAKSYNLCQVSEPGPIFRLKTHCVKGVSSFQAQDSEILAKVCTALPPSFPKGTYGDWVVVQRGKENTQIFKGKVDMGISWYGFFGIQSLVMYPLLQWGHMRTSDKILMLVHSVWSTRITNVPSGAITHCQLTEWTYKAVGRMPMLFPDM